MKNLLSVFDSFSPSSYWDSLDEQDTEFWDFDDDFDKDYDHLSDAEFEIFVDYDALDGTESDIPADEFNDPIDEDEDIANFNEDF